ncbi:hypothetical protein BYT27DRAFT_7187612 [Phlegmacium glaucopus]|nr:hypothetical protein BYT27DRAFT_7187612 [Phlegmacium glaucopus]
MVVPMMLVAALMDSEAACTCIREELGGNGQGEGDSAGSHRKGSAVHFVTFQRPGHSVLSQAVHLRAFRAAPT